MDSDRLVEEIRGHMEKLHIPGVAVGIRHGDESFTEGLAHSPRRGPLIQQRGVQRRWGVIEAVSGKPFTEVMQEMLLDPLEMDHTYLLPWDLMTHRFAVGHSEKEGHATVARPWSIDKENLGDELRIIVLNHHRD